MSVPPGTVASSRRWSAKTSAFLLRATSAIITFQCPLLALSGHLSSLAECPLLGGKADIHNARCHIRFLPPVDAYQDTQTLDGIACGQAHARRVTSELLSGRALCLACLPSPMICSEMVAT
jgi:hypothetical protein